MNMIVQDTQDIDLGGVDDSIKPSLLKAFSVFEQQCQSLEISHRELKHELDKANVELQAKNVELARRLAENEEMKSRLSGILETIADGVFLLDGDSAIVPQNQEAERIVGFCPGLMQTPDLVKLIEGATFVRNHELTVESGTSKRIFIVTYVPREVGALLVLKDVSEYRELLKRVDREDRLTALGHVAANVAHEIRNPLHGVAGFVQLLQRDVKGNADAERQVDRIMQATRQLNSVVSNLLSYTREMKAALAKTDLGMIAGEVVEMLKPRAQSCEVELNFLPNDEPLPVKVDGVQIKQVISNLVTNAIEACDGRDSAVVLVSVGIIDEKVFLKVEDTGCGMSEDDCERVFEPFYTSKSGGIGLGLALCRRIMDANDAGMELSSRPDVGTTFDLTFSLYNKGVD